MKSSVQWQNGLSFKATNRGIHSHFDTNKNESAEGPSPKEMLLNAMCACSGMDVVSIAEKMRTRPTNLKIDAEASMTTTIPSYFSAVHLEYFIEGDIEVEKAIKIVAMSMTKYCGVSFMLSKVCPITYKIFLNEKLIHQDQARFSLEVL